MIISDKWGKLGPAFGFGVGCGIGVGAGLLGGVGLGFGIPGLQVGAGLGAGCGLGVGFGYGLGKGKAWDRDGMHSNLRVPTFRKRLRNTYKGVDGEIGAVLSDAWTELMKLFSSSDGRSAGKY
ncbi:hypothetical protein CBR_g23422 [Chara braunii]|uniref:Uncharacterized protein n=1 Tax=Chara braunii TaxID=69332 RepID=A0A388L464_CHABU|nr:hypothetical protein CBR_g23422 [Chara braunii]|eukprot:GBG77096.1 hypothetical protein CBR_g23422 [Chara braunii]